MFIYLFVYIISKILKYLLFFINVKVHFKLKLVKGSKKFIYLSNLYKKYKKQQYFKLTHLPQYPIFA